MIWFGLFLFYSILHIVGYLMPNPANTEILKTVCVHILLTTSLNEPRLIFSTQLNSLKYFFLTQIILFTSNHLFAPR